MKLLITGGTGFIGRHVVMQALDQGIEVIVLYRHRKPDDWAVLPNLELIKCDLEHDAIPSLVAHKIDCVIHLASEMTLGKHANLDDHLVATSKLLAELQRSNIRKLIGMSSMSVLAYERFAPSVVIDETARVESRVERMGKYSALKMMQERIFIEFGKSAHNVSIILRPGIVYDDTSLNASHAGIVKDHFQLLVSHTGRVPLVSVTMVANAILRVVDAEIHNSQIFHLTDDHLPTQHEYQAALVRRQCLRAGSFRVNWRLLSGLTQCVFAIFYACKRVYLLPDMMLPHAFSARLKPFQWSNDKVKKLLNWQATSFKG